MPVLQIVCASDFFLSLTVIYKISVECFCVFFSSINHMTNQMFYCLLYVSDICTVCIWLYEHAIFCVGVLILLVYIFMNKVSHIHAYMYINDAL